MDLKWLCPMLLAGCQAVQGAEPLYVKNLSPVAGLLGLPSQRSADIGSAGQFGLALHGSIASHYVSEGRKDEFLNLDGETARIALEARYALGDNWDLQLEVPWLRHSGGNLDSLIDNWHDLWGMSDGGRSDVEQDILDYHYIGADNFTLVDDSAGLGDTSIALGYRFFAEKSASAAIVAGYKFATGEEKEFLGSGADDAYLALRFSGDHRGDLPLRWHGQLGYLYAGESELIETIQERHLWFAGLALDWRISQAWSLLGQVDAHAAPADSAIKGMGEAAVMLSVGARWRASEHWALDLSLVEDIQVETAPDVVFQAGVRWRP